MSKNTWSLLSLGIMILGVLVGGDALLHEAWIALVCGLAIEDGGIILFCAKGNTTGMGMRPLIRAYTHNGVTAVADEESYEEAFAVISAGELHPRPEPKRIAYFTDDAEARERLGVYYTGSIADLKALAEWCRIARSEMAVRQIPRGIPVDLTTFNCIVGEGIVAYSAH